MGTKCLTDDTLDRLCGAGLSREELAQLDAHIDQCAACRVLVSNIVADEDDGERPSIASASVPPELAEPRVGEVLGGRFEIAERIGVGGMAEVFRARDRVGGVDVVVKIPRSRGEEEVARFEREAALLVTLDHPAIVKHVASGRAADGTPFLAMEWLEGEDLAKRLRRGALSVEETLVLGERLAGALGAAHRAGVVHRDVKPSNVVLPRNDLGEATLVDFGVARRTSTGAASAVTRTGVLLGTLGYMAPEQALGAKSAGPQADVFSLGCILFECLTGERAFGGAHAVQVLAKTLAHDAPSLRARVKTVPSFLDGLVARMLGREPSQRPADGDAVLAQLGRVHGSDARRRAWAVGIVSTLVAVSSLGLAATARSWGRSAPSSAEAEPASVAFTTHAVVVSAPSGSIASVPTSDPEPSVARASPADSREGRGGQRARGAPNNAPVAATAAPVAATAAPTARTMRPHIAASSLDDDPFGESRY